MNSIFWIIILAILILIEIMTLGITTIWFAGGALVAFVFSLYFDNLILEVILFLAVSFALLLFTRPILMRHFHPKDTRTNDEGVVGKYAMVISDIDNMTTSGQVEVDGQEWSARSLEGNIIERGCRVTVKGITGTKLIVVKARPD